MNSINSDVNSIHQAFCDARGFELNMRRWVEGGRVTATTDDAVLGASRKESEQ